MSEHSGDRLPENLRWSVVKNTTALGAGRVLIAVARLIIAGIIVRTYGKLTFGEYSLVMSLIGVAEWVADFGVTEAVVREICQQRERRVQLLRIVTAIKGLQVPLAYGVLVLILVVLRYPNEIVQAGLVGGLAIVFYGGVLIYRVQFKAALTMELEIFAEAVSVLAMIGFVLLARGTGLGLTLLLGCHALSRAVYFGMTLLLGRTRFLPSVRGVARRDVHWCWGISVAMGLVGFLVGIHQVIDLVLLSKLSPVGVPYYAAAQRLTWPLLMTLAAIGSTLYPILATYWESSREEFGKTIQRGVNTVAVLAGLAVCSLLAGAEFYMSLIGPELAVGAAALRVLAVLALVRALSATLGPVLYVVHAQRYALAFITIAVVLKTIVLALLASRFGYLGVAYGALAVDLFFSLFATVYLIQRFTRYRIRWGLPVKVLLLIGATATAATLVLPTGGAAAAVVAPLLYIPLAFLTGSAQLSDVRSILKWNNP